MADTAHSHIDEAHYGNTQRDFLLLTTGALGAVDTAITV